MRLSQLKSAFTLIELLVVIAILGLLATMLMPAVTGANESAIFTADGNNLKQLMTMYKKHQTDTRQTWAYPGALVSPKDSAGDTTYEGSAVTDATAVDVTNASFWELARQHEIDPDLFNSPAAEPQLTLLAGRDDSIDWKTDTAAVKTDIDEWLGGGPSTDYMLDWSTPKTAGTIRPTLSNRDHDILFGDKINVCFADTHMGTRTEFELADTGEVYHLALGGSGSAKDDILSGDGDEVGSGSSPVDNTLKMARGNRKRASMK